MAQLPNNLNHLVLNLSGNSLENEENIKYLKDGMKFLPKNLLNIELNLNDCELGENLDHMINLGEVLKYLPSNL